ncbi:type I polyketide synthase [Nocardia sp. XZ_19_385]|uniref:type I polyketide synthase n=1 Tax=Nocardia sp. XZ_19_385 TaxID=2769488 RepID=UPI00188F689F|nr:type I polyketide synthase [Nocardia sp. XZ_19_385]
MSDIAIVGIGCRYAGGIDSPASFWNFVLDKRDAVTEIPADRWDYKRFYDPEQRTPGRMYTKRAAFLTGDPWAFDPDFFGISPREATAMDPQQRLILEVAWEALDDAGVAGRSSGAPIGVYVGAFTLDQLAVGFTGAALAHIDMHSSAGTSYTMLSNRISYALNLAGPSYTVDTACSSSLVALHLACSALDNGDCESALAGGVNLMLQPGTFISMCKGGFLAADGRSKSFGASADGYGRGEGAGMVLLKRLADAERDGDRVYAVVKATGSNQDGRTTAITVPNADAQERLAKSVTRRAGIDPIQVRYVEAHGTGTPVGDPLELRAIGRAYGAATGRADRVGVGSLKSTLGHTEAAAGIAGVIKSALAVYHRTLPPQGWLDEEPNPELGLDELGLEIQTEARALGPGDPMTVAVNGFGYGGTNAHAIVQEYRSDLPETTTGVPHFGVLPLSARSARAVRELAGAYAELLRGGADADRLAAAAWTRRNHHQFRIGIPFGSPGELLDALDDFADGAGRDATRTVASPSNGPVFVFTGMGPQWFGMGRELLGSDPEFTATAHRIDDVFTEIAGWSILDELRKPEELSRVTSTEVAQPANFLIQVALYEKLTALGVTPSAIVGHSVGEVSAAYVSGVLSLREALTVAYHRARLQARTAGTGGMLAVGLPAAEAAAWLDVGVDLAAVNSPNACTLSGDLDRLAEIAEDLTARGIFAKQLHVEVPYHSSLMDPILEELHNALAELAPRPASIPLYSTVTGALTDGQWDAEYWCANVRRPVRFADAIGTLVTSGAGVFVEVGPHPVLGANIREILIEAGEKGTTVATLRRKQPDPVSMRQFLAGLYAAGTLDIAALFPVTSPHQELPRYPWQRTRLRSDIPVFSQHRYGSSEIPAMLGDPDLEQPRRWTVDIAVGTLPWIEDHVVDGTRILPGAAYLDAALSAASLEFGSRPCTSVEQVRFVAPLVIESGDVPVLELTVEDSTRRFTIRSRTATGSSWTVHATGRLVDGRYEPGKTDFPALDAMTEVEPAALYAELAGTGVEHGPSFQLVRQAWVDGDTVVARIDASMAAGSGHLAHPCVLDAAWQVVSLGDAGGPARDGAVIPIGAESVRRYAALPDEVLVVARLTEALHADIDILDTDHNPVLRIVDARFQAVPFGGGLLRRLEQIYYEERWVLRAPLERVALVPAETTATVVVELGAARGGRAEQITRALPHARFVAIDSGAPGFEAPVLEALRAAHAAPGIERLHLCVVAGTGDIVGRLWTLSQLALAVEGFADSVNPEPLPLTGDGSLYATLVTERAIVHPEDPAEPDPEHAALAGARRVLLNEQPPVRWRLVDTDPDTTVSELLDELAVPGAFAPGDTDEVFLRNGLRWSIVVTRALAERLAALDEPEPLGDPEANFALDIPRSRLLSQLGWRRTQRRAPGPGAVEVRMEAIGLGFKDPLKILGVLGENELGATHFGVAPGMEGAGTVVRVGAGVEAFQVGDRVGLASPGMVERYHVADAALIGAVADSIRPELCTSMVSMVTAEYALLDLARVRAGDTVLVHGAAGGVGSCAIQVAKLHGATVIGAAGSDERRAWVLDQGADAVVDSRSLNFVDDVLGLTAGRGADIVISTAPGEVIHQNFKAVAEFGRIVEIGKADIYSGGVLELRNFDKNVCYYSFDLDRMLGMRTAEVMARVSEVFGKLAGGVYRPVAVESFGTDDVVSAFEEALRSTRLARIALHLGDENPSVRPQPTEVAIDPDGRYLITGGYGAFGLATGRWLIGRGARHLVLVGRSGATTELALRQLSQWRAEGIEVSAERADITDPESIRAVVNRVHTDRHPLRGVFHAAGVLDDQRITTMDRGSLTKVFRPKLDGARTLSDALTGAGVRLDLFVLFSSGSAIMGGIGQYSYTAANLALQSFTEQLARRGERVLCIGWGAMSGGGMVDADETVQRYLRIAGFDAIDMDQGTEYLGAALRLGVRQAAIIPVDWSKVVLAAPQAAYTARVADLIAAAAQNNSAAAQLREQISALDEGQRSTVVGYLLAEQLAEVMGVAADSIALDVPLPELGLDSLMAVEWGALVTKTLGVELNSMQLGRSFSLGQAGARIADIIVGDTAQREVLG